MRIIYDNTRVEILQDLVNILRFNGHTPPAFDEAVVCGDRQEPHMVELYEYDKRWPGGAHRVAVYAKGFGIAKLMKLTGAPEVIERNDVLCVQRTTGKCVKIGDLVVTFRGENRRLHMTEAAQRSDSSGRVYLRDHDSTGRSEGHYPGVIDCFLVRAN